MFIQKWDHEMIEINLTDDEVMMCQHVGHLRSVLSRGNKVKDMKRTDMAGLDIDAQGVTAEYAVAKHFNVFFDLGLSPRTGSADGVMNGYSYDVKSTHHALGKLLATLKDNPDVDMYIMCITPDRWTVKMVGWCWKKELINKNNIKDLGYGKGYALEQSQLRPFKK
jgi:hypothetical protein